jgi:hypothetical protein
VSGKSVLFALLVAIPAHATSIFVAPVPSGGAGGDDTAQVLTRTIETAVLQKLVGVDIVTPRALESKLDADLAKACTGEGDDASCVVDFAQAMGVDYVMRTQLAHLGDARVLTISLYSGKRAALIGQAQKKATRIEELVDDAPNLVAEVAKAADLRTVVEAPKTVPYLAYSEIGGGAVVLLASAATHAIAFGLVEPAYEKASFDKNGDELWENLARPTTYIVPFVGYAAGIGLVWLGFASLPAESGE